MSMDELIRILREQKTFSERLVRLYEDSLVPAEKEMWMHYGRMDFVDGLLHYIETGKPRGKE